MAVFNFDFIDARVVAYNFEDSAAAHGYNPAIMPLLACGFFVCKLSEELLKLPEAEFEEGDKEKLADQIGKPIIWMEESGLQRYPEEELKAILLHEQGHIHYGDIDHIEEFEVKMDYELRADAYAADVVGKRALTRALKRTIFIVSERRFGKGEKATKYAKDYIRNSQDMQTRLKALK